MEGCTDAAKTAEWRLSAIPNADERVKLDWTPKDPVGPPVDPKTGRVIKTGEEPLQTGGITTKKGTPQVGAKTGKVMKTGKEALEKGGRKFLKQGVKVIPFIGIVAGAKAMIEEAAKGNYGTAALEGIGMIPFAGDLVDALRLGLATGEVINEVIWSL